MKPSSVLPYLQIRYSFAILAEPCESVPQAWTDHLRKILGTFLIKLINRFREHRNIVNRSARLMDRFYTMCITTILTDVCTNPWPRV